MRQVVLILIFQVGSEIISESHLEKCYQNDQLNCAQKLLISLTTENAQSAQTEKIEITQLTNGTILESPIQITITKSQVLAIYPLTYQQDYNSQPIEQIITSNLLECEDDNGSDEPTCGYQYDSNDNKILDSQGYCCSCSMTQTIGLSDSQVTRGNICQAFNLGTGSAIAHCLKFDTLWYSSFQIGGYSYYYEITIDIQFNSTFTETIHLGTQQFVAKSSSGLVISRLIGDFTPLQPPEDLQSYYLMKPSKPITNTRVLEGSRAWMFIPREMVTVDSTECNKIGVGYSAFRNEPNNCGKPVGSCLLNQLDNLYRQDLLNIANNESPKYLLTSKGSFKEVQDATQTYLMQEIQGKMPTLLTLEIDATAVRFITNVGQGVIDFANISNFESQSGDGLLVAQITNTGRLPSEFQTSLNCSKEVQSLIAQTLFLEPLQSYSLSQQVAVQRDFGSNHTCEIKLFNNLGDLLDSKLINFETTTMEHINTQNNGTEQTQKSAQTVEQPQEQVALTCNQICSNFWDFICFIKNTNCSQQIYRFFSVIIIIILVVCGCSILIKNRKKICKKNRKKKYKPEPIIFQPSMMKPQDLESQVYVKKHHKYKSSYQRQRPTSMQRPQSQISIRNSQYEDFIFEPTLPKKLILYANLFVECDELAKYLENNVSIPLVATKNGNEIIKLTLHSSSLAVGVFRKLYQDKWKTVLFHYLETVRENSSTYSKLLTPDPIFETL